MIRHKSFTSLTVWLSSTNLTRLIGWSDYVWVMSRTRVNLWNRELATRVGGVVEVDGISDGGDEGRGLVEVDASLLYTQGWRWPIILPSRVHPKHISLRVGWGSWLSIKISVSWRYGKNTYSWTHVKWSCRLCKVRCLTTLVLGMSSHTRPTKLTPNNSKILVKR